MLSISKLFEAYSPQKVTNLLRKRASSLMTKGDMKSHQLGLAIAGKASQLDPKRQALRKRLNL